MDIFRSSGDTLTRENFYKLKSKLAEARLLTMQRSDSTHLFDTTSKSNEDSDGEKEDSDSADATAAEAAEAADTVFDCVSRPISTSSSRAKSASNGIVRAIRSRIQAIRSGELLSIIFIRTRIPRKPRTIYLGSIGASARAEMWGNVVSGEPVDMEISGHIDLDMRMKTENILPYLNGEARLVPKKTDLTFYNWDRGTASYNSTSNFQVVAELPRLLLRHTESEASLDITTSTPSAKRSMESKTTRGSGWQHIRTSDEETYAMIFDVYILYEDQGTKNSSNNQKSDH